MHKLISIIFLLSVGGVFSQSIENVDFRLEGRTIVVTYDFFHSKADTAINVELVFKDQQGGVIAPKTISGDIKYVNPGESKRIVWDVLSDSIRLSGKYKAEVKIIRFNSVKIGNQVWMTENLNVDRFQNGDIILEAKSTEEWGQALANKQPAWCYYDNDPKNGDKYGKLYNFYAMNDSRGLAPHGWQIPSESDWTILTVFLGGENEAGNKMKSKNGWSDYEGQNGNGTNVSGFFGIPAGSRLGIGWFRWIGEHVFWWVAVEEGDNVVWRRSLQSANNEFKRLSNNDGRGMSVRCISD
jgi:uncharacterized protein (TIGR02145 family)